MTDNEEKILIALAAMADQYLRENEREAELDSIAMGAGERALEILFEYGLAARDGKGRIMGHWTEAGRAFVKHHLGYDPGARRSLPTGDR